MLSKKVVGTHMVRQVDDGEDVIFGIRVGSHWIKLVPIQEPELDHILLELFGDSLLVQPIGLQLQS